MRNINMALHFLALIILLGLAKSINAQEVEDEREFDYAVNSPKGPNNWGKIKKDWVKCNEGTMQSPIDLSHERVRIISTTEEKNYTACNATITNRGHDIQMKFLGDAGLMTINGTNYHLVSAHWHSPSEHTINGRRYDMELHLVHVSTDLQVKNNISVLGMLYKIGKPDKFLSMIVRNVSSIMDEQHRESPLGMVDPAKINSRSKKYFRYQGSLTVPPCTEGVIWTINKKVKTVSRHQVNLLREAVHDYAERNARPLQAKNSRDIYLYGPGVN
ncbi:Alpha carbonic anhydrase 7 [Striga hermonthica]|uniref:Carbonic anhydrase n=1 Tax=Striga hermonthica TaxID=68872 RepID=A0A9N7NEQ7_STRHE|nr:Alpha carbonic anhydrase 7 [Striga hermonthica]